MKTATEISPQDHIEMTTVLAGINGVVDESASKTIYFSAKSTPADILSTFILAHDLGLKNISIYRDTSLKNQPRDL